MPTPGPSTDAPAPPALASIPGQLPRFACNWEGCHYRSKMKYSLKQHLRTHTGEKPFKCRVENCHFACSFGPNLKNHYRSVHSDERGLSCFYPGCSFTCKSPNTLRQHQKIHTDEKPYACTWHGCEHKSRLKNDLRRHMMVHTGEKPFVCTWGQGCEFRALRKVDVTKHVEKEHFNGNSSIEKNVIVNFVRDETIKPRRWATEMVSSDPDVSVITSVRQRQTRSSQPSESPVVGWVGGAPAIPSTVTDKFRCTWEGCTYSCGTKPYLLGHIRRIHIGQSYPCGYKNCEFKATNVRNLNEHKRTHYEQKLSCTVVGCEFVGRHKTALNNHMSHVHRSLNEQLPCVVSTADPMCNLGFSRSTAEEGEKRDERLSTEVVNMRALSGISDVATTSVSQENIDIGQVFLLDPNIATDVAQFMSKNIGDIPSTAEEIDMRNVHLVTISCVLLHGCGS